MVREPILLRSVLHDREIEVALTMARIEPLSTQPGPVAPFRRRAAIWSLSGSNGHAPLKRADRIDANDPIAVLCCAPHLRRSICVPTTIET